LGTEEIVDAVIAVVGGVFGNVDARDTGWRLRDRRRCESTSSQFD
jgi:hypothetical protein